MIVIIGVGCLEFYFFISVYFVVLILNFSHGKFSSLFFCEESQQQNLHCTTNVSTWDCVWSLEVSFVILLSLTGLHTKHCLISATTLHQLPFILSVNFVQSACLICPDCMWNTVSFVQTACETLSHFSHHQFPFILYVVFVQTNCETLSHLSKLHLKHCLICPDCTWNTVSFV